MTTATTLVLYHWTTADRAASILRDGFRDGEGDYGFRDANDETLIFRGVWLSDRPLRCDDFGAGPQHDTLLRVTLSDAAELAEYEVVEEGHWYREWLIPAAVLNPRASVERLAYFREGDEV